MIHGKITVCKAGPIFMYLKNHYCPHCGTLLKIGSKKEIVNSESAEAKNYCYDIGGDTFLCGNIEFKTKCFICPRCNVYISFDEIKKMEKQEKFRKREQ